MSPLSAYTPLRPGRSRLAAVRYLHYHCTIWGEPALATEQRPPLVMLHGWMDVGASFQFAVDALAALEGESRYVLAPDWRGFGRTEAPGSDTYWFADYLADLDALLDAPELGLPPGQPVDLLGHSMGGNVAMLYAGVRPQRIRRLVNLEGFGMPASRPEQASKRYAQWLDELKTPARLRPYDSLESVAARLMKTNPLLPPDKAAWLAPHWARQQVSEDAAGLWHLLSDPAHKRVNPVLYRKDEVLEIWKLIAAPMLWVEGELTDIPRRWGTRYPRDDFEARLAVVQSVERVCLPQCGHMLHHDQPQALAGHLARFLGPA